GLTPEQVTQAHAQPAKSSKTNLPMVTTFKVGLLLSRRTRAGELGETPAPPLAAVRSTGGRPGKVFTYAAWGWGV
ncbi:hypothetical protein RA276_31090, partial [Pseudomonas syringae pv. tagetis]|uniref:hypothetical protein n=1 Tax=Pseudomonas syringae group genomosp. 7 TaxID=251699 RepID=UPI00376F8853